MARQLALRQQEDEVLDGKWRCQRRKSKRNGCAQHSASAQIRHARNWSTTIWKQHLRNNQNVFASLLPACRSSTSELHSEKQGTTKQTTKQTQHLEVPAPTHKTYQLQQLRAQRTQEEECNSRGA